MAEKLNLPLEQERRIIHWIQTPDCEQACAVDVENASWLGRSADFSGYHRRWHRNPMWRSWFWDLISSKPRAGTGGGQPIGVRPEYRVHQSGKGGTRRTILRPKSSSICVGCPRTIPRQLEQMILIEKSFNEGELLLASHSTRRLISFTRSPEQGHRSV